MGLLIGILTPLGVIAMLALHLLGDALVRIVWLARLPHGVFWAFNRIFTTVGVATMQFFFGMRIAVSGQHRIDAVRNGPFVIVANHNSPSDVAVVARLCSKTRAVWVARAGLAYRTPYYSFVGRHYNACFLARSARAQNISRLRALGQRARSDNFGVIIFPEGRKGKETYGDLLPFRQDGLTALLEGARGATLLPVAISGSGQFLPTAWAWPRPRRTIRIDVLPPIRIEEDITAVAVAAEKAIRAALTHVVTPGLVAQPKPTRRRPLGRKPVRSTAHACNQ